MKLIRRRYKLGTPGLIYIGITLLLGLGALNSDNNLLYFAFGFAAAGILVSGLVSGAMMMKLRVERRVPSGWGVGRPAPLAYALRCGNRFIPAFGIQLEETPRALKGTKPSWSRHLPRPRVFVAHVGAGGTVTARVTIEPTRRGVCTFSGVRVSSAFPFGIFRKSFELPLARTIEVYPEVRIVRRDLVQSALGGAPADASSSSRRGDGDEFYGLRDYRPGDSLRHVAWRASAKRDEIVVREHLSMRSGELWLALNLEKGGTTDDDSIERAITLVASLAVDALAQGLSVGVVAPLQGQVRPLASGARQRMEILSMLARLEPSSGGEDGPLDDVAIARVVGHGPCLVVHAGDLDPSVGPGGASHLTADDLDRLTIADEIVGLDGDIRNGADEGSPERGAMETLA